MKIQVCVDPDCTRKHVAATLPLFPDGSGPTVSGHIIEEEG